jgi:hypothetical protein
MSGAVLRVSGSTTGVMRFLKSTAWVPLTVYWKGQPHLSRRISLINGFNLSALLGLLYSMAPYADIPHWWRHLLPNAPAAVATWFTLLNVGGAILAAIPVALGVVLGTKARGVLLGLVIGVVAVLYIAFRAFIEFGVPPTINAWVVDVAQFFAVSLAVVAVLALIRGFPLTIGSSDRGPRLRWGKGGSR